MPQSPKVETFIKQPNISDANSAPPGSSPGTVFNFSSPLAIDMSQCSVQQEKPQSENYFVNNNKGKTMNVIFGNSSNSLIIPPSSISNHSNIHEKAKSLTVKTVILPTNELNACISTTPIIINPNLEKSSLNIEKHNLINTQLLIPPVMSCSKASSAGSNIQNTNIKYAKQDCSNSDGNSGIIVLTQSSLADILNTNTLTTTNSRNNNKRDATMYTGDVRKPVTQQFFMINSSSINTNLQVTCSTSAPTAATATVSVPSLITTNQILTGQKSIMLAVNSNNQQTVNFISFLINCLLTYLD